MWVCVIKKVQYLDIVLQFPCSEVHTLKIPHAQNLTQGIKKNNDIKLIPGTLYN